MNERLVKLMTECAGWTSIVHVVAILDLIEKHRFQYIVEVNVFDGRTFLPLAFAAKKVKGLAVAIDPFQPINQTDKFYRDYAHFDFQVLKKRLVSRIDEYQLTKHVKIICKEPEFVSMKLPRGIDFLHISGHYGKFTGFNIIRRYIKKVKVGGFIWVEAFSQADLEPLLKEAKVSSRLIMAFDKNNFVLERT